MAGPYSVGRQEQEQEQGIHGTPGDDSAAASHRYQSSYDPSQIHQHPRSPDLRANQAPPQRSEQEQEGDSNGKGTDNDDDEDEELDGYYHRSYDTSGYSSAAARSETSLPLYRSRSGSLAELNGSPGPLSQLISQPRPTAGAGWSSTTDSHQAQYNPVHAGQTSGTLSHVRAVDYVTGQRFENSVPAQQQQTSTKPGSHVGTESTKGTQNSRRVDWAEDVRNAVNSADGTGMVSDEKAQQEQKEYAPRPGLVRTMSDYDNDDENAFDDYDWSDDDELVKQLDEKYEQEYKKQKEATDPDHRHRMLMRRFSPVHLCKVLFTTFLGNVILILLLLTPALVVQFLVKNPTNDAHLYFVCDNIQAWCYWIAFNFIARWAIHFLFELIPRLFVFVVEMIWGDSNEKFRGWVEVFTASKNYFKPLFFAGFFFGSFAVTFNSIFHLRDSGDPANKSRAAYTYRLYQVVELLFFVAVVYSVEKIIIRLISLKFHAVAFAERIKENAFALSTIDRLKDYRPKKKYRGPGYASTYGSAGFRSGASTPTFGSGGRSPATTGSRPSTPAVPAMPEPPHHSLRSRMPIPSHFRAPHHTGKNASNPTDVTFPPSTPGTAASVHARTPDAVSETFTPGRHSTGYFSSKKITTATAQEIAKAAMVDPLKTLQNPNLVKNGLGLDFASAADGKKLARDLFYAFRVDPTRNYLVTSDFYPAFPTQKEAEAAFAVFDKDGNGDISRPEIRATILAAYKERRFLARSLQDVSEAVSTLDRLFQVASWFIIALIAFAVFNVNIYSNLTTAYTTAIAISFIFKSAAQNLFDSVIFLFATHPFDSGDRVVIETEVFVVKQLGLFSTLFTKWDGTETMIANSKLGTLTITNFRRSSPQFENATLQLGWNTTMEQLDALEAKLNEWLQKDEKRMFSPSTAIVPQKFVFQRYMEVTIGMSHRANWQDWGERWNRRTAFHAALIHYTKELGITYYNSLQPIRYWQEDLDAPPIMDDDDGDDLDDLRSPLSPIDGNSQIPAPMPPAQPLLGFLPPEGSTVRRRKGRSRKTNMAGVGA